MKLEETVAATLTSAILPALAPTPPPAPLTPLSIAAWKPSPFLHYGPDRAYNPLTDFDLGDYGVDTATNHVWAVLDHNSQFATTPEPTAAAFLGLGTLLLAARRRRNA